MAIRRKTPNNQIKAHIEAYLKRKEKEIIDRLGYLGTQCVNAAREPHPNDWTDRTANLRASTGFLLLRDGIIINKGGFESVGGKGEKGAEEGETFAKTLIQENNSGFVLIVVAGMNYARYVEARNKDVLTTAELFAIKKMPGILKRLKLA